MATEPPGDHPVLLFDGVCSLCVGAVQFVVRRDPEGLFRFAPLQSPAARALLEDCDVDPDAVDTVVLLEDGSCHVRSAAAIRTAVALGGIYRLLGPLRFVPRPLRDAVYGAVARRRYGWFGRRESCLVPTPDLEDRFLAGSVVEDD